MMIQPFALIKKVLPLLLFFKRGAAGAYLEEILLGRCYFDPPFPEVGSSQESCPLVVESFLNLLASHDDSILEADDFFDFIRQMDFSCPSQQKPIVWLKLFDGQGSIPQVPVPPNYVLPETTRGGKLMQDLVFCGAHQSECNLEHSRAYWKFWQAAYYEFAQSLHANDELIIVVEPHSDVQFLERSIVPFLVGNKIPSSEKSAQAPRIASVVVYETEGHCEAENVQRLMTILRAQGMERVDCRKTMWELWEVGGEEKKEEEEDAGPEDVPKARTSPALSTSQTETCWLLIIYMGMVLSLAYCATEGIYGANQRAVEDAPRTNEGLPLLCEMKKTYEDDDITIASSNADTDGYNSQL